MSKVAQYLNEHLLGEVTTNEGVRRRFATDGSVLTIMPDMVIYPRTTSDVRKIARFSWQLAEKGHRIPMTPRGGGTDQTGAAIGSGVVVNMMAHMDQILEIDAKQRLVRVQPGVTFKALNDALRLQGLYIPSFPVSAAYSTIGGAVANNTSGVLSGKYGSTSEWVHQLEIVLTNGEVLQTGRVNKKELSRKKGLQTYEGEIYRSIDNLIVDNNEVIDTLAVEMRDNVGYNVVDVRHSDGSIDLAPLFVGSQGTLGLISEIILKTEHVSHNPLVGVIAFVDYDAARDGLDVLRSMDPSLLELIDGRLLAEATERGKRYQFYTDALENGDVAAVALFEFDDAGDRTKKKIAKKIEKLFNDNSTYVAMEHEQEKAEELRAVGNVTYLAELPDKQELSAPPLLDGAYVPSERFEDFAKALAALETKHHVELPLCGHAGQNVYYTRPLLNLQKVGDRHKAIKLLAEWSAVVAEHGGHLIGEAGEGRLKAPFSYNNLDKEITDLYAAVKGIFDPLDIMNSGVKQSTDLRKIVELLRDDYDGSDFANYVGSD